MFLFLFSLLVGCPLPPEGDENSSKQGQNNAGPQNRGNNQFQGNNRGGGQQNANQAGNAGRNAGGPPGGKGPGGPGGAPTDGVLHDMDKMSPQKTQDEIKNENHFTVSGTIAGDCSGNIQIDVIEISEDGPPEAGGSGPLTFAQLDKPGPFAVAVPAGVAIRLAAVCDNNQDRKITEGEDLLSQPSRLGEVTADISDVSLSLEKIGAPGEVGGQGGPGAGGPGAGGPGSTEDGQQATENTPENNQDPTSGKMGEGGPDKATPPDVGNQ